ncbi:MAG: GxxExxY protein [Verrucomicrobia bacterium]|nr:GxxExxY protein [Verrucomicrobiota bacterium]MBU4246888.1 GxxExxY protein [Verrucomicrobiota bacterium]MBU4290833.1 GxxExxY protein [Verrucomicrobiota bacterium]MBU4496569.1 GxxExxY protein [Verrucomicrobiota bacterium]MCG2680552.1 GxxExxY protein [Kiritimatiellia bacterium]
MNLEAQDITGKIIGAAFEVYRELGYGFLEKVYQKAMMVELHRIGLRADMEHPIHVRYKTVVVGDYAADLFVENQVMVEIKVAKEYNRQDEPQLLNELKGTGIKVGLLINFGRTKVEFKRMVF